MLRSGAVAAVALAAAASASGKADLAACKITPATAKKGLRVRRGPDWDWGDQDEELGGVLVARALPCKGMKKSKSKTLGWWKVRWGKSVVGNTYRVGCDGKYDLAVYDCGEKAAAIASSCAFNDLFWPTGAVPSGIGNSSCERDADVLAGGTCGFTRPGHVCDVVSCTPVGPMRSVWSNVRPQCRAEAPVQVEEAGCRFDELVQPAGAVPSGQFAGCLKGGVVPTGDHCAFVKASESCDMATCTAAGGGRGRGGKGVWSNLQPKCRPAEAPSPKGCSFNDLTLPIGASPQGETCVGGGIVAGGAFCTFAKADHECDVAVCSSASQWSTTRPACKTVGCPFSALTIPSGAAVSGEGCEAGKNVRRGTFCALTKPFHTCDLVLCSSVWSNTQPSCRVTETAAPVAPAVTAAPTRPAVQCMLDVQYTASRAGNVPIAGGGFQASDGVQECAGACGRKRNCQCFTYQGSSTKCTLFSECSQPTPRTRSFGFVSGAPGCVPPVGRQTECKITKEKAQVGMSVMRGPHWLWSDQDGMSTGQIIAVDRKCQGGVWAKVLWTATGISNYYRVGCNRKFDLCAVSVHKDAAAATVVPAATGTAAAPSVGGGRGAAVAPAPAPVVVVPTPPSPPATPVPPPAPAVATPAVVAPDVVMTPAAPPSGRGAAVPSGRGGPRPAGRGQAPSGRGAATAPGPAPPAPPPPPVVTAAGMSNKDFGCKDGVEYKGTVLFDLKGVSQTAQCTHYCLQVPECAAATISASTSHCVLVNGVEEAAAPGFVGCLKGAAPAANQVPANRSAEVAANQTASPPVAAANETVPAAPTTRSAEAAVAQNVTVVRPQETTTPGPAAFRCSGRRTFAGGDLFHFLSVKARADCEAYCAKVPECVALVFNSEAASCTLKAFLTSPQLADSPAIEACVRVSGEQTEAPQPEAYKCDAGMQYVGTDLMLFNDIPNQESCVDYCSRVDDCTAVTFTPRHGSGMCALRGGQAALVPGLSPASVGCAKPGIKPVTGARLSTNQDLAPPTVRTAQTLSHDASTCPDGSKWFILSGSGANVIYINLETFQTTTERPLCFGYECQKDANYFGGDWFRLVGIETIEQCEQTCNNIPLCVGFVHRAACPHINNETSPKPSIPRCKTCDIKCVVGELVNDTEDRHSMACKSTTRQGCEQKRVRIVMKLDNDCANNPPFATQAAADAFLANLTTEITSASLTVPVAITDMSLEHQLCCTRHQYDWEEDKIYQEAACKSLDVGESASNSKHGFTRVVAVYSFPTTLSLQDLITHVKEVDGVIEAMPNSSLPYNKLASVVEPECKDVNDTTDLDCISNKTGNPDDLLLFEEQVRSLQDCINKCDLYTGGDEGPCLAISYDEARLEGTCYLYGQAFDPLADKNGSVVCRRNVSSTPAPTGMYLTMSVVLPMTLEEFNTNCKDQFIGNLTEWLKGAFPEDANFSAEWVDCWAKVIATGEIVGSPTLAPATGSPTAAGARRFAKAMQAVPATNPGITIEIRVRPPAGSSYTGPMPAVPAPVHREAVAKSATAALRIVQPKKFKCESGKVWEGGDLEWHQNVATAEKCLKLCSADARCVKSTYAQNDDGFGCFLKGERAVLSDGSADVPSVACEAVGGEHASAEFECDSTGSWVGGDLLAVPDVPSADECKDMCQQVPADCDLYVYTKTDTCILKNSGEAAHLDETDPGATSCHAASAAVESGYQCKNGEYIGSDVFQIEGVPTLRECQQYCSTVKQCTAVSWDTSRRCSLKGAGAVHWSAAGSGSVSCARTDEHAADARDAFRCEADRALAGEPLMVVKDIDDAEECLSACRRVDDCRAVTFQAGTCELQAASSGLVDKPGAVVCVRDKPATVTAREARDLAAHGSADTVLTGLVSHAYSCHTQITYQGGTLQRAEDVASSEVCQEMCSSEPECRTFVYDVDKVCWLKSAAAEAVTGTGGQIVMACTRQGDGERVGSRASSSTEKFHCSEGAVYIGGDIFVHTNVVTLAECEAKCAQHPDCAVAVHTARGSCFMKSSAATAVPRSVLDSLVARRADIVEQPTAGMACVREHPAGSAGRITTDAAVGHVEGFHCEMNRAYVGGELLQLADVSGEECQVQCSRVPQCAIVVFSADRTCSLRTASAAKVHDERTTSVACSRSFNSDGPTAAASAFRCASHAGFEGQALMAVDDVASSEDCIAHCTLVAGCEAVAQSPNRTCSLYGAEASLAAESVESQGDVVACKRSESAERVHGGLRMGNAAKKQQPVFGWSCGQRDFEGGDLFVVEGVPSVRQCQEQCARIAGCASLAFSAATGTCTLKSATAAAVVSSEHVGCMKVENPKPVRGAPECMCASNWVAEQEGGQCGSVQRGCPAKPCDGGAARWCRVANPGCATAQFGGWAYCDDSTKHAKEGVLVDGRFEGLSAPVLEQTTHTYTLMKVGGSIGIMWDSEAVISGIDPSSVAGSAVDAGGVKLHVGMQLWAIGGCKVQQYDPTPASCVLPGDTSSLSPSELAAKYAAAAGEGTSVSVEVRRDTSAGGKIYFISLNHAIHIPHVTNEVFYGVSPPDFDAAVGDGIWLLTRVKATLGSMFAPTAAGHAAVKQCVEDELKKPHNKFRAHMNPILLSLGLLPLDGQSGRIVQSAESEAEFDSRNPRIGATMTITFENTPEGPLNQTEIEACMGPLRDLIGIGAGETLQTIHTTRTDPKTPAWLGDDVSIGHEHCTYGYGGPFMGCMDSKGRSVWEERERFAGSATPDPYAEASMPIYYDPNLTATWDTSGYPADFHPNRTEVRVLYIAPGVDGVANREAQFNQLKNNIGSALALLTPSSDPKPPLPSLDALTAKGACGGSLVVELEEVDRAPPCNTPQPPGLTPTNDSDATPIPNLAPFDEGWESTSSFAGVTRRLLQANLATSAAGRQLLQYRPTQRRGQTKPVVDSDGNAVYDPQRRYERIMRAESRVAKLRDSRTAQTLQFDEGFVNNTRPNWQACTVGVQSPMYGLMSSLYDLPGQPITGTFAKCKRECEQNPLCYAFSREAIGTVSDQSKCDCYLKGKVLPYCGDQYAFEEWGTYVVRCPEEHTPCVWTALQGTAIHVIEEYKTRRVMNSPSECRDVCQQLPDCMGVSWRKKRGGHDANVCFLIHEKEGQSVAHEEYTSFICKRPHAATDEHAAYTPAPPSFGTCDDEGKACNDVVGGQCFEGKGTFRCGCGVGYMCTGCATSTDPDCGCHVAHEPKLCKVIVTKPPASLCDDQSTCGDPSTGNVCWQLGGGQHECGCLDGYHCNRTESPECALRSASEPKSCINSTCLDLMLGPDNADYFRRIPTDPTKCPPLYRGRNKYAIINGPDNATEEAIKTAIDTIADPAWCGTCADINTMLSGIDLNFIRPQWQDAIRRALDSCYDETGLPRTPRPASGILYDAYIAALRETLQECSDKHGGCFQVDPPQVSPGPWRDACIGASCAADLPMEPADVSVSFFPVHSTKIHKLTIRLRNISADDLAQGGLGSDALEAIREQLAEKETVPLDCLTVGAVCVQRGLTGEDLGCFDGAGNSITPSEASEVDNTGGPYNETTVCEAQSRKTWSNTEPRVKIAWTGQSADLCEDLCCPAGYRIKILDAFFGRKHCSGLCYAWPEHAAKDPNGNPNENCNDKYCNQTTGACDCDFDNAFHPKPAGALTTAKTVARRCCGGKEGCCTVNATDWAGHHGDPCPGENKYLWLNWTCEPIPSAPARRSHTLAQAAQDCGEHGCRVSLTLDVKLDEVAVHRLLRMPGGELVQLEPADSMPSNSRVVESLGESSGSRLDDVRGNNAIHSVMEQRDLPFVSEGLQTVVNHHVRDWASQSGVEVEDVCHEEVASPSVDCSQGWCTQAATADLTVRRTSCSGTPECTTLNCNNHGEATGFYGQCHCTCSAGYAGDRCQQCEVGYRGYPACKKVEKAAPKGKQAPKPTAAPPTPAPVAVSVPSDEELRGMKLAGIIAEAQRLGISSAALESKRDYVEAIRALRRRQGDTRAPTEALSKVPFRLLSAMPPRQLHAAAAELRQDLARLSAGVGAVDVRILWACGAAACEPECPKGAVESWATQSKVHCAPIAGDVTVAETLSDGSGSVVEFEVRFTGGDTSVRAAVAEALLSRTAKLPDSPLRKYGVLAVATSDSYESEPASPYGRLQALGCLLVLVGVVLVFAYRRRTTRITFAPREESVDAPGDVVLRIGMPAEELSHQALNEHVAHELGVHPRDVTVRAVTGAADDASATLATVRVSSLPAREVVERCNKAPCTPQLPLVGAYLAADDRAAPTQYTVAELWIVVSSSAVGCSGPYQRVPGLVVSSKPVWSNSGGDRWLYMTRDGTWCITDSHEQIRTGGGLLASTERAEWPTELQRQSWRAGAEAAEVVIADRCPVVGGFKVGEQVTAAEDITEKGRVVIPIGSPGVVKGQAMASDWGVAVRFSDSDRDVDVLPDELDHVTGPTVQVLSRQHKVWRECVVVNHRDHKVKIHFVGYDHAYDEWEDATSRRIRRPGVTVAVGDTVRLSSRAPGARAGCLADGQQGILLKDEGPHRAAPFKVRATHGGVDWFEPLDLECVHAAHSAKQD
eukprot:TRINITY_DN14_c0_g1_i5.p1 TRINITY_DN14_c0_g1~~TRINITY_DN14_c0_g1_i5.p1  ORF type:complete len:4551 (+),score=1358.29 TRINITY_DN14_c0_g1_i5:154-13806(+)